MSTRSPSTKRTWLPRPTLLMGVLLGAASLLSGCSSFHTAKGQGDSCGDCCATDAPAGTGKPLVGSVVAERANNTNAAIVGKVSSGTLGAVERLDPRLDQLLAADAKMEKLVEGLDWAEGPVWNEADHSLYFSDVPQNVVYRWSDGKLSEFLRPSGYTGSDARGGEPGSNGLTVHDGSLYLCQHGDRRVARWDASSKSFVTVADRFEGKRFNSPNDLCFSGDTLFFTDPPYGLPKQADDPGKELDFQGVYRVDKNEKVDAVCKTMTRPNGIALSPDHKILYVANSDPKQAIWNAFDLHADGSVGEPRVFFNATSMTEGKKGLPDGMKVDPKGNLWATGPGGLWIFAPDGTHLGTLATGQATANCAFNADASMLYITADAYILRIPTLLARH